MLRLFGRRWILTTLLVAAGAALCTRLGVWQLDRLAQRRAFNAHVVAMLSLPPLDLPAKVDLVNMEYRAARASGTYDSKHEVALRNQYFEEQYGYHLVTPLLLQDGTALLVDRGWIPAEGNSSPGDWAKYDEPGRMTVTGILRKSQKPGGLGGVSDPTPRPGKSGLDLWFNMNLESMARQMPYPIVPVFLQLDPDPGKRKPPIPTRVDLDLSEGPHQGYAIQWFTFTVLLLAGYPFYVRRQESQRQ